MSASLNLAAMIGGVQIWDWDDPETRRRACEIDPMLCDIELSYDEIYVAMHAQAMLAGELAQVLHVLHKQALLKETREQVRKNIRAAAERILGEPWKLADEE